MDKNDILLIDKLKNNDPDAMDIIIEKYNQYVVSIISSILYGFTGQIDMQAVTNDVFFSLWKNADSIDTSRNTSLKSYIAAMARNAAINEKKKKLHYELPLEDHIIGNYSEKYDQIELRDLIMRSLKELKKNEQYILLKYYFQCKTVPEISNELGIPQSTIKSNLRRSRVKLKKILIERGYFYES